MAFAGVEANLKFNSPKQVLAMISVMDVFKGTKFNPPKGLLEAETAMLAKEPSEKVARALADGAERGPPPEIQPTIKKYFKEFREAGSIIKFRGCHSKTGLGFQITASEGMVSTSAFPDPTPFYRKKN